jgi:hypothetical protein
VLCIITADFIQINALFNIIHASLINYISITHVTVTVQPRYYTYGMPRVSS